MIGGILLFCGGLLAVVGTWRGYVSARAALGPIAHRADGDPTRAAVEAAQPLVARPRVRAALASVLRAVAWLGLAMYGLFLASAGAGMPA